MKGRCISLFLCFREPAQIAHLSGVKLHAPAKINLSLKVLGKREDGYHAIETVMLPLSLADTLVLERASAPGIHFTCSDPSVPGDDSNLVVKAARLFYNAVGLQPSIKIELEKRVPHGAGLGGGSSDAATTLLGLNALHAHNGSGLLEAASLQALAAQIGSDVPFFLYQGPALCKGRGEIVEPLPPSTFTEPLPLLLVKPGFGVPTPWAYSRWKEARELPGIDYAPQHFPWGEMVNDLERPVFEKYLFLATLRQWLQEQPESVGGLMSGSGATCFALLRDAADGPALEARVKAEFGPVWTALCTAGGSGGGSD